MLRVIPMPYPKVELPLRRNIEIDGRKDLMLLFALWIKTAQRSERSVIFKAAIDLLRDRAGDFEVGSELKARLAPGPLRARSIAFGARRQSAATTALSIVYTRGDGK